MKVVLRANFACHHVGFFLFSSIGCGGDSSGCWTRPVVWHEVLFSCQVHANAGIRVGGCFALSIMNDYTIFKGAWFC